jgi:hypothetical protein
MATFGDYREYVDSRLARLTPEQLAIVRKYQQTGVRDPNLPSLAQAAIQALRQAGYDEQQAGWLASLSHNVYLHPETDTTFNAGADAGVMPMDVNVAVEQIGGLPGSSIDTTKSEEDKKRTDDFVKALQQQAATGGGAWEQALQQGKEAATSQAASLAQSQSGAGAGQGLRSMAAGQQAAALTADVAGERLRAEQKQKAAEQLQGVLGGTQSIESAQSQMSAAQKQASAEAANTMQQQRNKEAMRIAGGTGQALVGAAMSDGGAVPGKPKVFGDDEANDTVPAMLSPGEIVIPRSIATAPDADRKAADFVAHVKAKHGAQNFDDGGFVAPPPRTGITGPFPNMPLSIQSGSLLETGPYSQARESALQNLEANIAPLATGRGGSSVIPWETKAAIDESNAAAMQAMAKGRGGDLSKQIGVAGGKMAAAESGRAMQEQAHFMDVATRAALEQRQRDLAFAKAQADAAWRNTMMNMGIDVQNRQAIQNMLAGAGQASMGLAGQMSKDSMAAPLGPPPPAYEAPKDYAGSAGDWAGYKPSGDSGKIGRPQDESFARGGVVSDHKRLRSFLAAMGAE